MGAKGNDAQLAVGGLRRCVAATEGENEHQEGNDVIHKGQRLVP
jgi:hypothetical protein